MPSPLDVYNDPGAHWGLITAPSDDDFESQFFDRKEAGRNPSGGNLSSNQLDRVRRQMIECLSAFANANQQGGLLVIGVSSSGDVAGIGHLAEKQSNSLSNLHSALRCFDGRSKLHECQNLDGQLDHILLVYVPHAANGLCETTNSPPRAWIREGKQNTPLDPTRRDQLLRERGILDFERIACGQFHEDDIDTALLDEFRRARRRDDLNTADYLYEVGALERVDGQLQFNNAGLLFFCRNPQRVLSNSQIRVLRYENALADPVGMSLPTLDKTFDGCLAQQIRSLRVFLKESGFFKVYQSRRPGGGFDDEPELPLVAVDEAIVNAVVHRDYGIGVPIECIRYTDGFIVRNPGRVLQRDRDLPDSFSLGDTSLNSMPRNGKITEWFRSLRDDRGAEFVRMLSEGTRRMRDEMAALSLPAPEYKNGPSATTVILKSRSKEREARLRASAGVQENSNEIANAFELTAITSGVPIKDLGDKRGEILSLLADSLEVHEWYIDSNHHGRLTAHRTGAELQIPAEARKIVRFYPAYSFQIREHWGRVYLIVDYTLEVKNVANVQSLLQWMSPESIPRWAIIRDGDGVWQRARIESCDQESCQVVIEDSGETRSVRNDWVVPNLSMVTVRRVLSFARRSWNFDGSVKEHSLVGKVGQARVRLEKTLATVSELSETVFPLTFGDTAISIVSKPVGLQRAEGQQEFATATLPEPSVEFDHRESSSNIRNGLTKHGSYDQQRKQIEIVPVALQSHRDGMAALIDRLKAGKYKYRGAERTFHTRLYYQTVITVDRPDDILGECRRLTNEHPDWCGNAELDRIFLLHVPEHGYELDDESSPYYKTKRLLFEKGIPCQMVDTPTIISPDWKDLNLALNVAAKCGVTPWVLPDRIPEADFFVGLSYTRSRRGEKERQMGYATVFNSFGRWEFYSGSSKSFSYEERTEQFGVLVEETLKKLSNLPERPTVFFHYSARFSYEDRASILKAARRIRPNGTYVFVSINTHHTMRLYDLRPEGDGSLARGSYVKMADNQLLLSTTGYNPFRKTLGTPQPLEINVWRHDSGRKQVKIDLRSIAVQMLSLTKLNWASTDSLCGEPITTKYAGDIAYLTAAFLRQGRDFNLHSVLERTAWFI